MKPAPAVAVQNKFGGVRHEALEELASSVRDLRAEVHGRPSLCERRFTSMRRSHSCCNLSTQLWGIQGMLARLVEQEEDEEEGKDGKRGGDNGATGGRSNVSSCAGIRRGSAGQRRGSRRSFFSSDGSIAASIAAAQQEFDGPRAAAATVESVYSLVSALYGLSDSRNVPTAVVASVLDYTPSVDLAFGRIKPVISNLVFESDFPCNDYEKEEEGGEALVSHLGAASRLLNAVSETVRHITDEAELTAEMDCCYVTLVELLGMQCGEVQNAAAIGHRMTDYAMGGSERRGSLESEEGTAHEGRGWKLSRAVRRTWEAAGHTDKIQILENHHGNGREGNEVDSDLFREVALMVLLSLEWSPEKVDKATALEGRYLLERVVQSKSEDIHDAMTLCRLGDIKVSMWEYDSALAHYEEALRIMRIHNSNKGPLVAAVLKATGNAHCLMRQYAEADSYYQEALFALKQQQNNDAKSVEGLLSLLLSWSRLKVDQGEERDAVIMLGRRLDIQREVIGADHPEVAGTLFWMGSLRMDLGHDARAISDLEEALRIRRAALGPDHPSVGDVLFNIGLLKSASWREDREQALGLLWDALRIQRLHGSDRLKEAETLAVIGDVHRTMGLNETAIELYGKCLELRMEFHGPIDEHVADVHVALGNAHDDLKQYEVAAQHYRAGLFISEEKLGETDDSVLHRLRLLGNAHFNAGNPLWARVYLEKYLRLKELTNKNQGMGYINAMHVMGKIRHQLGDREGSRKTFVEAQRIYALNSHSSRRTSLGKELLASVRELSRPDLEERTDDLSVPTENNRCGEELSMADLVRSFFRRLGRSMSMETSIHNKFKALCNAEMMQQKLCQSSQ